MGHARKELDKLMTVLGQNVGTSRPVAESIPGPTVQIPNPVRDLFVEGEAYEERNGLLFAGRLVSRKGVDIALQALSLLHERGRSLPLTVCGDGPERDRLEKMARRLNLADHVVFRGWTEPETLSELYRASRAALIPSRKEPFGIVALEAIASRCPVVASDVGGLPEAVGDCGVLVEPERPEGLADGIEAVLHPETRESISEAMLAHVERHRIDHIAGEYIDLLQSVVEEASK
jgi:glycosyltransferase involved in cell wall biosynthesis